MTYEYASALEHPCEMAGLLVEPRLVRRPREAEVGYTSRGLYWGAIYYTIIV